MPELKRLLVPMDFSEGSRLALRHALELAETFGAAVNALHVWEPSPYLSPDAVVWLKGEQQTFWAHAKHQLQERLQTTVAEVVAELPEEAGARPVATEVVSGYTSETILSTIREGGYDMVVMGTRGRTGLSHVLLGSVAERIVRMASCPVMTIKPRESATDAEPDLPKGFDTPTMI